MPYAATGGFLLNATGTSLPLPLGRAIGLLGQAVVPVQLVILGL